MIVSVPFDTGVTTPPLLIVACPLLLLQMPPGIASLKVTVVLPHRLDAPVMLPALGSALTVTSAVVAAEPQKLLTV